MELIFETLVPFEKLQEAPEEVFRIVEKYGRAVLLKNNAPAYIIMKPEALTETPFGKERKPCSIPAEYALSSFVCTKSHSTPI